MCKEKIGVQCPKCGTKKTDHGWAFTEYCFKCKVKGKPAVKMIPLYESVP